MFVVDSRFVWLCTDQQKYCICCHIINSMCMYISPFVIYLIYICLYFLDILSSRFWGSVLLFILPVKANVLII